MSEKLTYKASGVDTVKGASLLTKFSHFLKERPQSHSLLSGVGPFAAALPLKEILNDYSEPVLVTCCDGVGTKVKLGLEWNLIDGLGIDLVAMSVNDLLCMGAHPLLFLDYYACSKLNEAHLIPLLKSIQKGCELSGCTLAGGETAEMPGMYQGEEFDLAGFAVGIADRTKMPSPEKTEVGDCIVALASNGIHSNGYSLIRKLIDTGKLDPTKTPDFSSASWQEILMTPTQIYWAALRDRFGDINGLAHITGGGLYENLPRALPSHLSAVLYRSAWEIPPLFKTLQNKAGLDEKELLSTFNAGVGMFVICSEEKRAAIQESAAKAGIHSWMAGKLIARSSHTQPILWDA